MVHGRIEPTPAEQLRALRQTRDRYAALAEQLHESSDPLLDPDLKLAEERNARRIANAYEKSIANSLARMSALGLTHQFNLPSLGTKRWLAFFMVISAIEGALLLDYFHPAIFQIDRAGPQQAVHKMDRVASLPPVLAPVAPPPIAAAPNPRAEPQAPLVTTPKPRAQPAAPPPVAVAPRPRAQPAAPRPLALAPRPSTQALPPIAAAPQSRVQSAAPPPIAAAPRPSAQTLPPIGAATQSRVQSAALPPIGAAPQSSVQSAALPPIAAAPRPGAQPPPPIASFVLAPAQPAAPVPPPTRLEPVAQTHSLPPYPPIARSLGEEGNTLMRVTISTQGAVTDCEIVKSSGSLHLDAEACSYVQLHWRWNPPTRNGQPVTANTQINIVWSLKSTR